MRRQRFSVMLSVGERRALQALAREDGLSGSAVIRRLVCQEARRRSLWLPDQHNYYDQREEVQDA